MNRLGMLVDLSHVSADTMRDSLQTSLAPVMFSHSSVYAICPHRRNVPDDVLLQLVSPLLHRKSCCFCNLMVHVANLSYVVEGQQRNNYDQFLQQISQLHRGQSLRKWIPFVWCSASHRWGLLHPKLLNGNILFYVHLLDKKMYEELPVVLIHFLEHMDYVRQLIGVDYIGLGSDFDGME